MVTQGIRDRQTLKVNYPMANKKGPAGEVNPATQQIDFYIRSPQQNPKNTPGSGGVHALLRDGSDLEVAAPLQFSLRGARFGSGSVRRDFGVRWFGSYRALAAGPQSGEPASLIARSATYVEQYYARAQSLVAIEEVTVQPLSRDLGLDGFARRLVYELRVEWDPDAVDADSATRPAAGERERAPAAAGRRAALHRSARHLTRAAGVPAAEPARASTSFIRADRQTVGGVGARRHSSIARVRAEPPRVEWNEECASIDASGPHPRRRVGGSGNRGDPPLRRAV